MSLKARWHPSLATSPFKGLLVALIFSPTPLPEPPTSPHTHPTEAMGKGWPYCKGKNDHEADGSGSSKKQR
jgi:hypothetical protein